MSVPVPPSRLRPRDVVRVGFSGLQTRKLRATLSVLGIAIGIASLVGVLGLSESSKSDLLDQISALGTNLLQVSPGTGFGAGDATLPEESVEMMGRVATVEEISFVNPVEANVYRNEFIPSGQTGGISVVGSDQSLLDTLNGEVAHGTFLTAASLEYPAVVLGSVAAERIGLTDLDGSPRVLVGDRWLEVIGILAPFALAPDLDRAAIIGHQASVEYYDAEGSPTTVYLRVDESWIDPTRDVLPATADPENPEEVEVSRPSDLLEAQAAAESQFANLFLGLGAVALLVGGIGIANVMVIGVLERRGEIGLRRAIGATRGHILSQFLTEALILSLAGGVAGVLLGVGVTAGYSATQDWRVIIPGLAVWGGLGAAVGIGALAGIYPALRAARMSPTEALRYE
ncbi:ABC transporter permease [Candidatus Poriferisocius sp.]|uniref:ABC transporter permease n=1 Tax=Candidatus Poriferisocius sp. TaxID=3101276 RepID=UPI003B5B5D47